MAPGAVEQAGAWPSRSCGTPRELDAKLRAAQPGPARMLAEQRGEGQAARTVI